MAKIFDWLKPTGNPAINGYDLSSRQTFSMPCGALNVAYSRMFIPRTKVDMALRSVVNTLPLVNQAFTRGQFLVDVFQVPYTQLYRNFNEFYSQANEVFSSQDYDAQLKVYELPSDIAHANLFGLLWYLAHDIFYIMSKAYPSSELLERPSWTDFELQCQVMRTTYNIHEIDRRYLLLGVDVHNIPVVLGALRLFDMTGYGNWYMFLKDFILNDTYKQDYGNAEHLNSLMQKFFARVFEHLYPFDGKPKSAGTVVDSLQSAIAAADETFGGGISYISHSAFNHISWESFVDDMVTYFDDTDQEVTGQTVKEIMSHQYYITLFPILAYQKIFADIYRNTFYDSVPAYAFNIDDLFANNTRLYLFENDVLEPRYNQLLQYRYRQFKNDMFTCLLPSSQLGDVSMVQAGDSIYNINLVGNDIYGPNGVTLSDDGGHLMGQYDDSSGDGHNSVDWKLSPTPAFSVLVQRRAEALQKYKERYLRAGNRLKDQFISTFGKVPYYLEDKYCRYIGSMHSDLNLQAVPATNDTGNYDVGERASYGYSGMTDKVSLNIDDFSVVMALAYYIPEADYEAFNLDPAHTYSEPFDFPVPEFENIGLHSVTRFALSMLGTPYVADWSDDEFTGLFDGNENLGFGPAWLNMKTDVDRVHMEFGSTPRQRGVFHSWVTTRGNVSMRTLSDYYVAPDYLNSVFVQQQNSLIPSQDQILCVFDWDIKVAQPLTVVGLPIWN